MSEEQMVTIETTGELNNHGVKCKDAGDWKTAQECFEKCIEEDPTFAAAHQNLGVIKQLQGQLDQAIEHYSKAMELEPEHSVAGSNMIFLKDLLPEYSVHDVQAERRAWGNRHTIKRKKKSKVRIGYVGGDFSNHSAANVFGAMLLKYNRKEFEVFVYANQDIDKKDQVTQLFAESVDYFYFVDKWTDYHLWGQVQWDEIDILVDLSAHSAHNRLTMFSMRAAPIQITAWGYALGTGLKEMDYFFTDATQVPKEEEHFYTEQIVRLPCVAGYWNHRSKFPDILETEDRPFTFGSLNRLAKHSAECLALWREVLMACPEAYLLFKTPELGEPEPRERLLKHFEGCADRVHIMGPSNWEEHVGVNNYIDVALDPFPHGGGVTTLEAMGMGVPVLTLKWDTVVGRMSSSMIGVHPAGGHIAETQLDFVDIAKSLYKNGKVSVQTREDRRAKFMKTIIGDPVQYCRVVEGVYRDLLANPKHKCGGNNG